MAHFITTRPEPRSVYRFGSAHGKSGDTRVAPSRVHGYLKYMIELIAEAKVKRVRRELELRGIRYDRANDRWITQQSRATERS